MRREEPVADEFRELPGLPAYGPMPLQFSSTGQGMHREGFVVEFLPDTEESWVGNFQPGLTGYSIAITHPDSRRVIVISGGEAYVVDPRAKKVGEMFGGAIEFVASVPDIEALVFGNGLWFEIIRADGSRSATRRISWDGMTQLEVDGSRLRGEAYDPLSESSVPFEVNVLDATHTGGSYPRELAS